MKKYTQLTSEQRYQISGLKKEGWKQAQIAAAVGACGAAPREIDLYSAIHVSTVLKEIFQQNKSHGNQSKNGRPSIDPYA